MKELEEIDIKILKILLQDGRKSFTAIAEQCKTSEDTIWIHYKEMKKAGIIGGATTQLNYPKLGYDGVATIMVSVQSQNINEVYNNIKKIPDLHMIRYCNSIYNIATVTTLKTIKDIEKIKQTINKENKNKIEAYKTHLWIEAKNTPENIFHDPAQSSQTQSNDSHRQESKQKSITIDQIDMQIINILTKNGRMSFNKMAEQIGASTSTIARRYENLKQNNYIKVSIQIDPSKTGFQSILETNIALTDQSEINTILDKISKIPGVSYIIKISGTYDLSATALVKDCTNTMQMINEVEKIPNIKKMESTLRPLPPLWPGPRQYITTFQ